MARWEGLKFALQLHSSFTPTSLQLHSSFTPVSLQLHSNFTQPLELVTHDMDAAVCVQVAQNWIDGGKGPLNANGEVDDVRKENQEKLQKVRCRDQVGISKNMISIKPKMKMIKCREYNLIE